jgi:hypothetical protein
LIQRGSQIKRGEAINTARNSSVRLRFTDGGETVVRPESSLLVSDYQFNQDAPEQDNMLLRLVKGGLRALTGAVGKRGNVNAYQLRVNTATIGIRGTDFSVRLCKSDCAENANAGQRNSHIPVAARVVEVVGKASVFRGNDDGLPMSQGKALYSSDVVETAADSYAVVVYSDNSRLTLNPSSRIAIKNYSYDQSPKAPPQNMLIELLKGGLRFATGLIGQKNKANMKFTTTTATIGIRGTVFDLVCAPAVSSDQAQPTELKEMPCAESLFAQTRDGAISLASTQGPELEVAKGQTARVDSAGAVPRALTSQPEYFRTLQTPEPEKVVVDLKSMFGAGSSPDSAEGVFLMVHEGRVAFAQGQSDLTLDAGESAFAGANGEPVRLQSSPALLDFDSFLSSAMFNVNMCRR